MPKQFVISIVDDDVSVRDGMVGLMQSHGYAAVAFESGRLFLDWAGQNRTACLIADVHMPGMTGLELLETMKASGRDVPTILITARRDEAIRRRAFQLGVYCYLAKPFAEDDLMECLRSALATREGHGT